MKKLLFAALLFSGFAFLAPRAEAGSSRTVFVGYDRCGRPVYQQVETHSHCAPQSSRYRAPVYVQPSNYYQAPAYYGSSIDSRSYNNGRATYDSRCSSPRPRFAISFGF